MSIVRLLLKAAVSFTASSCLKHVLPNLCMHAALINSLKWVWSKHIRTMQLALACETAACYTQRQTLWKEQNQLEDEVHLKLGGENIVVAVVITISSKFSCYRAVGCIKMGKHKFTDEIAQRKRQKAKHKLKFTPKKSLHVLSMLPCFWLIILTYEGHAFLFTIDLMSGSSLEGKAF